MPPRVDSFSLTDWVFWMVRDILESGDWKINICYTYVNMRNENSVALPKALNKTEMARRKYVQLDAFVDEDKNVICIDARAKDRALCLFHECLEILFSDWKDSYFVPRRWGITNDDDSIRPLEDATWAHLSEEQQEAVASFLPKIKEEQEE